MISATNRELGELIARNLFREDLYYRLDVIDISLPPLKDRGEDAIVMANILLKKHAATLGKEIHGFTPGAVIAIRTHAWPGNIRELVNRIRRAVVMADEVTITPDNLGLPLTALKPDPLMNGLGLKEAKARFEAEFLAAALTRYRGNVQLTARALKTSRSVVYQLMQKYKIREARMPR